MKTRQIKKTGKLFGASLLTLALFTSSFGWVPLSAKAENEPLNLYYISDSTNLKYAEILEEVCNYYESENQMEINLTSLIIPAENFENLFIETNFFLDEINSDSLVILDIRNSIRPMPNDDDTWADYLLYFFQSVKDENCRTMFICETDETWFNDATDFLDYVDVHINTDLITPFMYNILKDMEDREDRISDVSLIFDRGFSYAIDTFILPLLRAEFYISAEDYPTPESVWNYLNENAPHININLYLPENGRLVNKITGEYQSFGNYRATEEIYNSFDKPIYAIGNNYYSDSLFQQFVVDMKDALDYMEMPAYMLIQGDVILGEVCPIEYFQTLGMYECTFQEYLKEMVFGFINDDDLSGYGNWQGRCYVTFKPIEWGTDGWEIRTYDYNDLPEGWQVVMDPETYRFYYGEE